MGTCRPGREIGLVECALGTIFVMIWAQIQPLSGVVAAMGIATVLVCCFRAFTNKRWSRRAGVLDFAWGQDGATVVVQGWA